MERKISLQIAEPGDVFSIHQLMRLAYDQLENKELFVCDALEFVEAVVKKEGFAILAKSETRQIVGVFLVRFPHNAEDNLGRDIHLDGEELDKVAHLESAVVHPRYRGMGLQRKMLAYAEELLEEKEFRYYMATVSPFNPASFKTLQKNGYKKVITTIKYNGLVRDIYLKEI